MKELWHEFRSEEQNRLLQPACRDLSNGMKWYGETLSQDSWRHLICGTVRGWKMVRGIPLGNGAPGFVMLGASSKELSQDECTQALELIFSMGDQPWEYGQDQPPVSWGKSVSKARGLEYHEA